MDVDLIARNINICVLHGKVDAARFLPALIVEVQCVLGIPFCICRKNADKAVSAEHSQGIVGQLGIGTAGRVQKRGPEAEELLVGDTDTGGIVDIVQIRNHLIDKVGMLDQMIICLLAGASEIVKGNIGFDGGIGHGHAGKAECLAVRRDCRGDRIAVFRHRPDQIGDFPSLCSIEPDPGGFGVIHDDRHFTVLGSSNAVDGQGGMDRPHQTLAVHDIDIVAAAVRDRDHIPADAGDRLLHFIGDVPQRVSPLVDTDSAAVAVLDYISAQILIGRAVLRSDGGNTDELRACIAAPHPEDHRRYQQGHHEHNKYDRAAVSSLFVAQDLVSVGGGFGAVRFLSDLRYRYIRLLPCSGKTMRLLRTGSGRRGGRQPAGMFCHPGSALHIPGILPGRRVIRRIGFRCCRIFRRSPGTVAGNLLSGLCRLAGPVCIHLAGIGFRSHIGFLLRHRKSGAGSVLVKGGTLRIGIP